MQIKALETEKKLKGIESMKADEVKTFFSKQIQDDMGKTYFVADTDAYAKFSAWAEQNGYRNEREAYSAYIGRPLLKADANGAALQSFGAAIGPSIAQGATPAISVYDQSNTGDWSNGGNPDNIRRIGGIISQGAGKPLAQMNDAEIEAALANLYNSQAITRMDVANLHKMWVEGRSRSY